MRSVDGPTIMTSFICVQVVAGTTHVSCRVCGQPQASRSQVVETTVRAGHATWYVATLRATGGRQISSIRAGSTQTGRTRDSQTGGTHTWSVRAHSVVTVSVTVS